MNALRVERDGPVLRITLARPERRNALDSAMAEELAAALGELEGDNIVHVVALTGEGQDFCVGSDVESLGQAVQAGPDAHRHHAESFARVLLSLRNMVKPVVAVVRGRALGIGAGLATGCDVVLAHEQAQFGYPDVRAGFVPALLLTTLRRAVGEKRAAELVLTGRIIGAAEAERIGLVSRVFPKKTFESDVETVFAGLTKAPMTALALTKWLLYKQDDLDFKDGVAAGVVTHVEAGATEDFKRGVEKQLRRRDGER
jgi:methylglutaconyl-CoA hydratase